MSAKLRTPSQWVTPLVSSAPFVISVLSFGAAFWTFYFTYWYRGELDLTLPKVVGVGYFDSGMRVLVPTVIFANTGSTRYRAQVYEMTADISTAPEIQGQRNTLHTRWAYEVSYMSSADFFIKYQEWMKSYPDSKPNLQLMDQLVYVGRALPFQLIGGSFVTKSFIFEEPEDMRSNATDPSGKDATLVLGLLTNSGRRSRTFKFKLPEKSDDPQIGYVYRRIVADDER
jgi:hypothetical protein